MADSAGMAEIRGIDIDKLAKGFADELLILKNWVNVTPTSAREIRWYKKTSGFLDSTDTTGITASQLKGVAELALPDAVEQTVTRTTSYVKKYFVESPIISDEDIKDNDPDIWAINMRDLVRAIGKQIETRIWDVATENRAITGSLGHRRTCSGAWDTHSANAIIEDIMTAQMKIRSGGYEPTGGVLLLDAKGYKNLMRYLIDQKGSYIPQFASEKVGTGVLTNILGLNVVVSQNITNNYGIIGNLKAAVTWKTFTPITARAIEEVGIGQKIRVWEHGEALLTDPKAICLLSGTGTT